MKSRLILLAICAAFFVAGCQKKEGAADSSTNTKTDSIKTALNAMYTAWEAGKLDELGKYMSENFVEHNPMPGQKPGLAGMIEMSKDMMAGFPDMKWKTDDIRVEGDIITARGTMSGTNSGPIMGMPATNKKVTNVMGIDQFRWENGKFVEHWGLIDVHTWMTQLGMMPDMAAAHEGAMGKEMKKEEVKKK